MRDAEIPTDRASGDRAAQVFDRHAHAQRDGAIDSGLGSAPVLALSTVAQERLIAAATATAPVVGFTHNFYRYPARFSPAVARAAIETLTDADDLVVDTFVGGGTTLVEALALGRRSIGTDISTLATFVSRAKTTMIDDDRLTALVLWARETADAINMRASAPVDGMWEEAGYLRHLDHHDRWRLRKALAQAVAWVPTHDSDLERLARCCVLRTAQWALDGRKTVPTLSEFRKGLVASAEAAAEGIRLLREAAGEHPAPVSVINRSAVGVEADQQFQAHAGGRWPRLIMTSPPYPGVHVLYHRWQVDGRKETRAPFWIANSLDGSGASYYTMGDRKNRKQDVYFDTLAAAQRSLAALSNADTLIVQIVAFSDPSTQLLRYNAAAAAAELEEVRLPVLAGHGDGRLWRQVPNRKWYTNQREPTAGSKEVVLFYRRAR